MKTSKRTTIILLTLLLLVASVGITAAMMIPSADELLTQSLETLETITDGRAVIDVQADLPDQSLSGSLAVWGKLNMGPNGEPGLRMEVLAASEAEFVGLTAVTNGSEFWLYHPASNTVVTGTAAEMATLLADKMAEREGEFPHGEGIPEEYLPDGFDPESFNPEEMDVPETPAEAVAKLLEYFTAERIGTVEMAGTRAYQLRLIPIPEKMPDEVRAAGGYLNVWLRSSDQLPLGVAYAQGSLGSGSITASLAEINTGLDDAIFTFDIPAGAEVIPAVDLLEMAEAAYADKAAEAASLPVFTPLAPSFVPNGARLAESGDMRGAAVQRFTLPEGKTFVVAQGPSLPIDVPAEATRQETVTVRGVDGILFSDEAGGRSLLTWTEGEFTFWVGGDIAPDDALAVAESLQ